MRTFTLTVLSVIALSITGCNNDTPAENTDSQDTIKLSDIQEQKWVLTALDSDEVTETDSPTLTIDGDGRAHGFNGCNRYFGPAAIENGKLTVSPLGSTRKFCSHSANQLERKINIVIGGPSSIELDGTNLIIKSEQHELRFSKEQK